MSAAYWLALLVCAALIGLGAAKGYQVWTAYKAKQAADAQLEQDILELERALVSIHSLNEAIKAVAFANSLETRIPETRILH